VEKSKSKLNSAANGATNNELFWFIKTKYK